ncbi:MAG: lysine--tRNA ligase [Planctomycetes bacterium]|nr:lysine--tRNA ligase [Planctomycetota bacterium]MCH9726373.1 lysine--tRNA ligase [Planctomycetota bacterium]MCH9775887.1 lysine--tRNA ligase [Planctomycetota bacterium]MCH9791294.1 lysine--tRNA ligase [Planctomycetota bacterium]
MSKVKPNRFEAERIKKLEKIQSMGLDPWGQRFDGHIPMAEARSQAPEASGVDGEQVRIAGRIMLRRKAGKLRFYDIKDWTGRIQLLFSRGDLSEEQWELMGTLDLGDLIGIDGCLRRTETGEISVFVKKLTVLCKSLAQPPEKHHSVKDVELLLRQRSLDLIYTEGVLEKMLSRSQIIDSIRQTLRNHKFAEVETPVLHSVAGGAAARPFITHHNTLEIQLYMRIALELHLKRLMVGGIERVYEIGRVFRNEGIDATHNPEFTMIEIYQAYGNYETMMDLTETIITDAVKAISDTMQLPWGEDQTIDFSSPWERKKYFDLVREHAGCDPTDPAAVAEVAKQHGIETENIHPDIVLNEVFEATCEKHLMGPVFVIDYPASICPLTKRKQDDPNIAERFELFVQGMELANAYTELNDPLLQEELFRTQLTGQSEEDSMATMDTDFIKALKVGMPPAGGLGIGIDRLVMLLTNSHSIRDVIYFPLLRPEGQPTTTK